VPLRVLKGEEYEAARAAANVANRALHRADSALAGQKIHEIQPVKFGGSPTDLANKIPLSAPDHAKYTVWWRGLQRDVEGKP
jgi:hypothetical protein